MENAAFKSVTFGGFDKQDVIHYIEETAKAHEAALQTAKNESQTLRKQNSALSQQADELQKQCESQTSELEQLRAEVAALRTKVDTLTKQCSETDVLSAELETLRPDAEAYRQFRTNLGDIECQARKRAADLEAETTQKLQKWVTDFQEQYQSLVTTFGTTSTYVTSELRKVEVNLSQLPRALDQIGTDLNKLNAALKQDQQTKSSKA